MVGIQLLERRINALREKYQSTHPIDVQLLGIVFTMSGGMMVKRYYREVMHRVTEDFSASKIFETRIPTDVNVSKAVDSYMPVVLSSPMSSGSKAFIGLTQEFLQKLSMIVGLKSQTTKMSLINLE
jgi:cellulose biosynthesis protein BcsQ